MPTVFMEGSYRFFFFSREETRRHVHVSSPDGEVKIWLEPTIAVANVANLSQKDVNEILAVVRARKGEIDDYWNRHFDADKK